MNRFPALAGLLLLVALPCSAQVAAPTAPTDPDLARAQARIAAGDYPGAIAALEVWRAKPGASPVGLATLGALYLETGKPQLALDVLGPLAAGPQPDPAVLYNAGRAAAALGQMDRAIEYWRLSAGLDPNSPARRELGLIAASQGRGAQALAALRPWALSHPDDVEARVTAASAALSLRRTADAEQLLAGLPQDAPQVQLLRARLALLIDQPAVAVTLLEPLNGKCPDQVSRLCRRLLAEAYLRSGKSAAAISLLQGQTGQDVGLTLLLADALAAEHRPADAVAALQPLVDKLPKDDLAALTQEQRWIEGVVARESGRYLLASARNAEAVTRLRRATEIDPGNLESWQLYAKAADLTGQAVERDRATAQARKILAAGPQAPPPAAVAEALPPAAGTPPPAGAQAASAAAPQMAPALRSQLERIRANLLLGRADEALTLAEQCVKENPRSVDALYSRGAAYMAKKDTVHAEADYRAALALQPEYLPAMNDLAVLLLTQNKIGEAQKLLQRVVALNPNDAVAKANLESLKPKL